VEWYRHGQPQSNSTRKKNALPPGRLDRLTRARIRLPNDPARGDDRKADRRTGDHADEAEGYRCRPGARHQETVDTAGGATGKDRGHQRVIVAGFDVMPPLLLGAKDVGSSGLARAAMRTRHRAEGNPTAAIVARDQFASHLHALIVTGAAT
jgi:hypothetical protein